MQRILRSSTFARMLLATVVLGLVVAPAFARVQVGQTFPLNLETAVHYTGSPDGSLQIVWEHEIVEPGATYIAARFADFRLASGDYLQISDALGLQNYRLQGQGKMNAGDFWARHIKGDTMRLRLYSSSPQGAQGFVIRDVAIGYGDVGGPSPEAICGADDKDNAICYQSSHPAEYAESRAVARMLISGAFLCTGWLASADNHLVTNEHCVTSASEALNTDYEFMAEASSCGSSNCQLCHPGDVYSGATFLQDNAGLDYSIVQINSGDPASLYGYLQIDDRPAAVGEEIYIPQHPGGRAKELGIFSSHSSDAGGLCHVNSTTSPPCSGSGYNDVGYYCDTEGGSSGSPVLARSSHKVIALHHCANCPNRGVPINLVYAEISGFLGPECTSNGDCDDGLFCNGAESCVGQSCEAGSDPCPGQNCDEGSDTCVNSSCGDGTCDSGEDCNSCPADCTSSGAGFCGNGTCEPSLGEDCVSCSQDCAGKQNGNPGNRYCCGDGDGQNPVGCTDARCTAGSAACSDAPVGGSCCGDGSCDSGEDACSCSTDCGPAASTETACSDGVDDDCDGAIDCADSDCDSDPSCDTTCDLPGTSCSQNSDCCSNKCRGPSSNKTCR